MKVNSKRFFIIGFMGSGKTYWGKIWAAHLGIPFFDLDQEIERRLGMPVKEIFEKFGEHRFRREEATQLDEIINKKQFLLSCGGGAPCFFDNMNKMKLSGTVVYLQAQPQYILNRVAPEIDQRPLLKSVKERERLKFIEAKLQERAPVYSDAHVILNVEKLDKNSLNEY